ncbi:hypothetical protein AALO_G00155390 [Alosa alosa]|uniref:Uncharacterized protein n=1 Tax=Alosa alosa TaxID=278164 RepID=A0AAV6GJG0_9TELE|nr:hypothetical protein AALO_G00155390 [Alosa alosa]
MASKCSSSSSDSLQCCTTTSTSAPRSTSGTQGYTKTRPGCVMPSHAPANEPSCGQHSPARTTTTRRYNREGLLTLQSQDDGHGEMRNSGCCSVTEPRWTTWRGEELGWCSVTEPRWRTWTSEEVGGQCSSVKPFQKEVRSQLSSRSQWGCWNVRSRHRDDGGSFLLRFGSCSPVVVQKRWN